MIVNKALLAEAQRRATEAAGQDSVAVLIDRVVSEAFADGAAGRGAWSQALMDARNEAIASLQAQGGRCRECNASPCECPSGFKLAPGAAAVGDGASALWALRQILHDLPDERGWMDPAVEKIARGLVARNPYADLATPSAHAGVEGWLAALREIARENTAEEFEEGYDRLQRLAREALAATPAVSVGDAKDTERYRWLRDNLAASQPRMSGNHQWYMRARGNLVGPTLDAAIDAAIASKGDQ